MKILTLLLPSLIITGLPSCQSTGASLTVGFIGKTETGSEYTVGLVVPLDLRKAKVAEPALPTGSPTGKQPVAVLIP